MLVVFSSPWAGSLPRSEEITCRPLLFQYFPEFGAVERLPGVFSAFLAGSLPRIASVAPAPVTSSTRSSHLVLLFNHVLACCRILS